VLERSGGDSDVEAGFDAGGVHRCRSGQELLHGGGRARLLVLVAVPVDTLADQQSRERRGGRIATPDPPGGFRRDGHLNPEEEAQLYRYYGMEYSQTPVDAGAPGAEYRSAGEGTSAAAGHDTSGPNTDSAMTRSEERLRVGTEKVTAGKARLRKFVETENVTESVPVSHDEVRVHREPITDANRDAAMAGGDITSEEHEVELTADRVVVNKETVPVERVRMDKATVTDQETVTDEVRKEHIEAEGVDTTGPSTTDR
jgi:uncharacterized protein (TIGR02271 family)